MTNKLKVPAQRNLPLDTTYSLIDTFYKSIEDGGCICENCGRLISNIAKVKDSKDNQFYIGLDCAETLTGIKNSFEFEFIHKARFNQAKQARSKILKFLKK